MKEEKSGKNNKCKSVTLECGSENEGRVYVYIYNFNCHAKKER